MRLLYTCSLFALTVSSFVRSGSGRLWTSASGMAISSPDRGVRGLRTGAGGNVYALYFVRQ